MKREYEIADVKIVEVFDKPSLKGNPTKDSLLITTAISNTCPSNNIEGINIVGFSLKLPGDNPVPRIGRSIAIRRMYDSWYFVSDDRLENCHNYAVDFFWMINKPINKKLLDRVKCLTSSCAPQVKKSSVKYEHALTINYLSE